MMKNSQLKKIKDILDIGIPFFGACIFVIFLWFITTTGQYQITSKSFEDLKELNGVLQNLSSIAGGKYINQDELIFEVRNQIPAKYFEKYYSLDQFVQKREFLKTYKYNIQELPLSERSIIIKKLQAKKYYFELDSLINDLQKITGLSNLPVNEKDTLTEIKLFHVIYPLKDLIIPDSILQKLEKIKNTSFKSSESFLQGIKGAIGLQNAGYYSAKIKDSSDWLPHDIKISGLTIIIVFIVSIIIRLIIGKILSSRYEVVDERNYSEKILIAEKLIVDNPNDIQPLWDIAYNTLQQYYSRNLKQINSIYTLSVSVMIAGFLLIVIIIITSFFRTGLIELKQLGVIAGILTEFIGATFLLIYKSTIQQAINHSKSLEEINKVGMAVKIISAIEITDSNKEKIENAKIDISQRLLSKSS
jgi:hypothetical protein